MKVALINAPYLDVYGPDNKSMDSNFPLGLGYIAAFLKKSGHEVYLLDPEAEGMHEDQFGRRLKILSPAFVGISCVTYSYHNAEKFARTVKEELDVPIVLGGHHASALPDVILRKNRDFDFVAVGEGEITMVELCQALEKKRDIRNVKGIYYRMGEDICHTPPRERINDFTELPYPARELVDLDNYKPNNQTSIGKRSTSMITSRGCPNRCVFCSAHNVMGHKFRQYPAEYVVAEIEHLVKTYGMEHVAIKDDTFTLHRKRVVRICELLLERNIKIYWSCNASVNTVDYDLLKLMKKAGCRAILYGIESGNPTVLKNMKKGITLDQCRKTLKATNDVGIKSLASFVFGLPGENGETIQDTINFAVELEPTIAMFFVLVPLPGSEMFDHVIKSHSDPHGIDNWKSFAYTSVDYLVNVPGFSNDDLRQKIKQAYVKFYCRPRQIIKMIRYLNSFDEFMIYVKGGMGLLRRLLMLTKTSS